MDEVHEDVTAAVAAHRELGGDYDRAIAEGLVERIGVEVDRRVDARLAAHGRGRRRIDMTPADQRRTLWLGIGIGSTATGIPALIVAVLMKSDPHPRAPGAMLVGLVGFWALLAVVYLVSGWVRRVGSEDRAGPDPAGGHTRH
jgi:hypothetical protein